MQQNKINSLQMLRAIAVILVMYFHITYFNKVVPLFTIHPDINNFFYLRCWGAVGVDIFFAISGFIMTVIIPAYSDKVRWDKFLIKRAIRIVPLYFLSSLYLMYTFHRNGTYISQETILKTFTILPVFDKKTFAMPVNAVGWTLAYEMYFYLLITIFLILKKNVGKNLLILIFVLSLLGVLVNPNNVILKFLTSPLLLEFGFGITCGLLYQQRKSFKILNNKGFIIFLLASSIALLMITIFTGTKEVFKQEPVENNNYDALFRVVIWGVPSAIFLLAVVLAEYAFKWVIAWWVIFLGDASYSTYLLHNYIDGFYADKIYRHIHIPWGGDGLFIITAISFTLIATAVFYYYIERPMTSKITQLVFKKNKV